MADLSLYQLSQLRVELLAIGFAHPNNRFLWVVECLKPGKAVISQKPTGFDDYRDYSDSLLLHSGEKGRQLIRHDELGCEEVGADQQDRDPCLRKRFANLVAPPVACTNLCVRPQIDGPRPFNRPQMNQHPVEIFGVDVAVAEENVTP